MSQSMLEQAASFTNLDTFNCQLIQISASLKQKVVKSVLFKSNLRYFVCLWLNSF